MSENRVIIACAGSGKTRRLVTETLDQCDRRIAILTYTNNNTREICRKFGLFNSGVPNHVDVMTWFSFLLRECARPYQRSKYDKRRIASIAFVNKQSTKGVRESNTGRYYFADQEAIYSDKLAKFVVECEQLSGNAVTTRLGQVYTDVFLDEFQDSAGWDFEVIRILLESKLRITLVGDPRQHVYKTNPSSKNTQYLGVQVLELLDQWKNAGLCSISKMNKTHRCNQAICDFANMLWPGMDAMSSNRCDATLHDGVYVVGEQAVSEYIRRFRPQVLRYDKKAKSYGGEPINFGIAKGLEFPRVLIVPTKGIKMFLRKGDLKNIEEQKHKLHVAITRAFYSVAFVYDGTSEVVPNRWVPCD